MSIIVYSCNCSNPENDSSRVNPVETISKQPDIGDIISLGVQMVCRYAQTQDDDQIIIIHQYNHIFPPWEPFVFCFESLPFALNNCNPKSSLPVVSYVDKNNILSHHEGHRFEL